MTTRPKRNVKPPEKFTVDSFAAKSEENSYYLFCSLCQTTHSKDSFSDVERKKNKEERICLKRVIGNPNMVTDSSEQVLYCSGCECNHSLDQFPESQLQKRANYNGLGYKAGRFYCLDYDPGDEENVDSEYIKDEKRSESESEEDSFIASEDDASSSSESELESEEEEDYDVSLVENDKKEEDISATFEKYERQQQKLKEQPEAKKTKLSESIRNAIKQAVYDELIEEVKNEIRNELNNSSVITQNVIKDLIKQVKR
jgi:hypothetical protein